MENFQLKPEYIEKSGKLCKLEDPEFYRSLLDEDLAISSKPVLPRNVNRLHKASLKSLNGKSDLILQIMSIKDISRSLFSQVQDEHKDNQRQLVLDSELDDTDNATQESQSSVFSDGGTIGHRNRFSPSRMLNIELTDGFSKVMAVEMREIPLLSVHTPIGAKVCINQCLMQRGVILLFPNNLSLLGGNMKKYAHMDYQWRLRKELNLPLPEHQTFSKPAEQMPDNTLKDSDNFDDFDEDILSKHVDMIEKSHVKRAHKRKSSNSKSIGSSIIDLTD